MADTRKEFREIPKVEQATEIILSMKLVIFQRRSFAITDKKTGAPIKGYMYGAFDDLGNALEFSTRETVNFTVHNVTKYDEKLAVEIPVRAKIFDGKLKYSLVETTS